MYMILMTNRSVSSYLKTEIFQRLQGVFEILLLGNALSKEKTSLNMIRL